MSNKISIDYLMLISVLLTVLFAGCATSQYSSKDNHLNTIKNTHWTLIEVNHRQVKSENSNLPDIQFDDTKVTGSNGCNGYVGSYEIKGNRIELYKMTNTAMACLNDNATNMQFKKALAKVKYFNITHENLFFYDTNKNELLKFSVYKK